MLILIVSEALYMCSVVSILAGIMDFDTRTY